MVRTLACGLLGALLFASQTKSVLPPRTDITFEVAELIAEKSPSCGGVNDEDATSADGRKVAWRCRTNNKWTVLVNGTPQGGAFDEVRSLTFSPDSQHVAFAARRDKRWTIVEDGAERPGTYADVGSPQYSADGKRLAFRAKPDKKWVLVVDGTPQSAQFDGIATWTFSPDGQRIAYVGRRGDKYTVVADGKEGTPFDIVSGIRFSSDSRRFVYAGADVKRGFGSQKAFGRVSVDGTAGPSFEGAQVGGLLKNMATGSTPTLATGYLSQFWVDTHGVSSPVFSPDGARMAYAARREKDAIVVFLDGEPGKAFPPIVAGPVFSPDNRRIAFAITVDEATSLVVDGAIVGKGPVAGTDFITQLTFAPDNQRLAYIGVSGGNMWDQGYTARARRRVYVDGVAGKEYDVPYLGQLTFGPDGQHVAYIVGGLTEGSRKVGFVVVNAREGNRYDDVFLPVRFDDDGRTLRYTAQTGGKFYAVRASLEGA